MLFKPRSRKQRAVFPGEDAVIVHWVFVPVKFGLSSIKFAEKNINTYRCSRLLISNYTEGFRTKNEFEFPRIPVNIASFFSEPCREASRGLQQSRRAPPKEAYSFLVLK
jgi:hypothetical protein